MAIPISSTEQKPLEFSNSVGKHVHRMHTNKIVWLHSFAPNKGVKYDLSIKDALGREKFSRKDYGNESQECGELLDLPTLVGEELTVEVSNIRGAESVRLFLN